MKLDDGILLSMLATEIHRNRWTNVEERFDSQKVAFAIRRLLDETVPELEETEN